MNNDWHRYVYLGILSIVFVGCIYIICYNTLFIIFLTVYFTCWLFFFIMMVVMTQSETLRNSVTARDVDVEMMTLDVNWLSTRTTHTHTYSNTHTMAIKSHLKLRKLGGCRESVAAARVVKDSQTTGTGPWQHNTTQHSTAEWVRAGAESGLEKETCESRGRCSAPQRCLAVYQNTPGLWVLG